MKKTNTPTKKTTTKKTCKPEYVIDLVGVYDEFSTAVEILMAKYEKGITTFTTSDLCTLQTLLNSVGALYTFDSLLSSNKTVLIGNGRIVVTDTSKVRVVKPAVKTTKKPNIFKRFWNWLTRKK